jgi:hypothetical protein
MDSEAADPKLNEAGESAWAAPVSRLTVSEVPLGATNLNVDGRQPVSPLQGFGQMWQKTFKIRLEDVDLTPEAVMDIWKANFQKLQPPENRFYPTLSGIWPGEVLLIEARVPPFPGLPSLLPVATGVMVLYADPTTFTVMTPEGHPESGWNTFSVYEEDGYLVAQAQSLCRPSDPLYEIFNRFLGSSSQQDKIWSYVLVSLAEHLGVKGGKAEMRRELIDPQVQWSQARNIWKNAGIRTLFYLLGAPLRWLRKDRIAPG